MNTQIAHNGVDLSGVNVFVGGPIQHAIQGDGFHASLRETISRVIDAVQDSNGTVFSAHLAEKFGDDTSLFTPEQVSVRDFGWMGQCDVFIPVLPTGQEEELLRTDGTHVELGWASALRTPSVLVTPLPINPTASHLLRGLPRVGNVTMVDLAAVVERPESLLDVVGSVTVRPQVIAPAVTGDAAGAALR